MDWSEFPVVEAETVVVALVGVFFLGGSVGFGLANALQFVGWVGGLVYLVERGRAALSH
ncbi:hypothetical protein ACFQMA_14225 [Halosimplex aquaticum]|uniref:Uncharacterized protein n=1 Tax=Halosimplex aquaticum TaxID=3026162 RepID=A0ABD5Y162_9EURY|nr:hypothetical protein [Halosimplex aquaticum]